MTDFLLPPFRELVVPPTWETLESFVRWFFKAGMPLAIPFDAEVFRTDHETAVCIFRAPPYQVELYLFDRECVLPAHAHPYLEVIQVWLLTDKRREKADPPWPNAGWGVMERKLLPGETHGGWNDPNVPSYGRVLLAFQKWPEGVPPSAVSVLWKGKSMGPRHEELVRRFVPSTPISDSFVDSSRGKLEMKVYEKPEIVARMRPPFAELQIPDTWDSLEEFMHWYVEEAGMPLAIPQAAEVFRTDDASAVCLFRKPPYQVELYVIDQPHLVPQHEHPYVEVIQMHLLTSRQARPKKADGILGELCESWGLLTEKLTYGEKHGAEPERVNKFDASLRSRGGVILAFQRWPSKVEPSTVSATWKGPTVGRQHEAIIRRFFPSAYIKDGYADITRSA